MVDTEYHGGGESGYWLRDPYLARSTKDHSLYASPDTEFGSIPWEVLGPKMDKKPHMVEIDRPIEDTYPVPEDGDLFSQSAVIHFYEDRTPVDGERLYIDGETEISDVPWRDLAPNDDFPVSFQVFTFESSLSEIFGDEEYDREDYIEAPPTVLVDHLKTRQEEIGVTDTRTSVNLGAYERMVEDEMRRAEEEPGFLENFLDSRPDWAEI